MEAQPKLVTCKAVFVFGFFFLFVCWYFNGLICLTERFTRTFRAVSSISVIGAFRNLFCKAPFCQSTLQTRSPPPTTTPTPLLAEVVQSIFQTSELLTLPGERRHSQRTSEGLDCSQTGTTRSSAFRLGQYGLARLKL